MSVASCPNDSAREWGKGQMYHNNIQLLRSWDTALGFLNLLLAGKGTEGITAHHADGRRQQRDFISKGLVALSSTADPCLMPTGTQGQDLPRAKAPRDTLASKRRWVPAFPQALHRRSIRAFKARGGHSP